VGFINFKPENFFLEEFKARLNLAAGFICNKYYLSNRRGLDSGIFGENVMAATVALSIMFTSYPFASSKGVEIMVNSPPRCSRTPANRATTAWVVPFRGACSSSG